MAARRFQRPSHPRTIGRKIIIACEGRATEPGYFKAIRRDLSLPTLRVAIVEHAGTDPRTVVQQAINAVVAEKGKKAWLKKDQAWAVFDGDEHRLTIRDNWNDAIQLANANNIELAISNPSFEFWYLLHFEEHRAHITRQQALKKLARHIKDYEKSHCVYPVPLKLVTEEALARAEELQRLAELNGCEPFSNPSTRVSALLREILKLAKES